MEFLNFNLRLLWDFFVGFLIPVLLALVIVLPLFDWISPWDEAVNEISREVSGVRILVGIEYKKTTIDGILKHYIRKREFVVFPAVFTDWRTYEYVEGSNISKGLVIHRRGAVGYLIFYLAFAYIFIRFSIPRLRVFIKSRGFRGILRYFKIRGL